MLCWTLVPRPTPTQLCACARAAGRGAARTRTKFLASGYNHTAFPMAGANSISDTPPWTCSLHALRSSDCMLGRPRTTSGQAIPDKAIPDKAIPDLACQHSSAGRNFRIAFRVSGRQTCTETPLTDVFRLPTRCYRPSSAASNPWREVCRQHDS